MSAEHPAVTVTEPAIFIRIARFYSPSLTAEALYEATRGVWVIGPRRNTAHYALAVADGIVREVYVIHSWHPAGTTPYKTRTKDTYDEKGRWEFVGEVAPPEVRDKYLDRSVAHYFVRGAANPITYVNNP